MQATKRRVDDRGWFSEIFHQERLRDIGITCRFVQDNQSSSKRAGTLRGLHFQLPAAQAKLVTVVKGRILDVAVDNDAARRPLVSMFRQNYPPKPGARFGKRRPRDV